MNLRIGKALVFDRASVERDDFYQEAGVAPFGGNLVIVAIGYPLSAQEGSSLTVIPIERIDPVLIAALQSMHPEARYPANNAVHLHIVGIRPMLRSVEEEKTEENWRRIGAISTQAL